MDSYDFPVKNEWRQKWRLFHTRYIPSKRKDRQYQTVLCLDGHEALETQCYLEDRFLQENITVINRNQDSLDAIKSRFPQVNTVKRELVDFVSETDQRFDVVSLDFTGNFSEESEIILGYISGRQLLKHHAVLGTNFLGKRESDKGIKADYENQNVLDDFNRIVAELRKKRALSVEEINARMSEQERPNDLLSQRDSGLSCLIRDTLNEGTSNLKYDGFLKEVYQKFFEEEYPQLRDIFYQPKLFKDERGKHQLAKSRGLADVINKYYTLLIGMERMLISKNLLPEFLPFIIMRDAKAYLSLHHEAYKYVSTNGAPMLSDFFHLYNVDYLCKEKRMPFGVDKIRDGTNLTFRFLGSDEILRSVIEDFAKLNRMMRRSRPFNISERIYLGSDAKGKKKSERIEKVPEEIVAEKIEQVEQKEGTVIANSTISKEEAIEFLKSGCSPDEICEAFQGFTIGQLRALKARHVTGSEGWK